MRASTIAAAVGVLLFSSPAAGQAVLPDPDPIEKPGPRPYEMEWAARKEPAPPTVRFDDLRGWTMQAAGGAEAELRVSRAQNVWDRPVARLRYRGDGKPASSPSISIRLPIPLALPADADSVDMWVYGNRWDWENPPDTPPVRIVLHMQDSSGAPQSIEVDRIRWKEWWLLHRRLASVKTPARLLSIEVAGGWQPEWREIFLDSLRFYREELPALQFAARPKRNLTLFPKQSPGANTGPGRLPFPTRELTILPAQMGGSYTNHIRRERPQGLPCVLEYRGRDVAIDYRFDPGRGLSGITATVDGAPVGRLLDGAVVRMTDGTVAPHVDHYEQAGSVVRAVYSDGTELRLSIRQKSLIVDVFNPSGKAAELSLGEMTELAAPRTLYVPPITYGGSHPTVLLSMAGSKWVFTSLWVDWYRSNGSEPYGAEFASGSVARINGGVRYHTLTDGRRNSLFERLFLTVSPRFEETLPVIANPVGLHASAAGDCLWQESWGPDNYERQMKRSRMLRAYGIEKLIQCNHEITWRDGGESFTLRTRAAPGKGGDDALKRYIAHQRGLGWKSGLYTNYTDFAPVNAHWTPDRVQRESSGQWRSAWPRNWALKPLAAVELDAVLSPLVHHLYRTNSAYTDVHTAVAPWGYTDYDARVPGAGTFAQTFYAYGELLRNDSRVYGGPIFSEGGYQWLYAGLADGNYGHTYNGHKLAADPLLPVFDLHQIHTRECDIGVSWTSFFGEAIPNWRAPENLDRTIDRFLLTTLAYGHIGWLVEEEFGIERACRSYYMLQQVQSRYALKPPSRIAYWDGSRLVSTSSALVADLPRTRRQLYVAYPGGLELWLNDHPSENWTVHPGGTRIVLPPAGWAAWQPRSKDGGLLTYSGGPESFKQDYLRSDAYTYLDGRGRWMDTPEAGFSGSLALRRLGSNRLEIIRISGEGRMLLRRPYRMIGAVTEVKAFDIDGKRLASSVFRDGGRETWIEPVNSAVSYQVRFDGSSTWSAAPARSESAPGSLLPVRVEGRAMGKWTISGPSAQANQFLIPEDAPVGSLVTATVRSGKEARTVGVRVCPPVEWTWRTEPTDGAAYLSFPLQWRIDGLEPREVALVAKASAGWTITPERNVFRAGSASKAGFSIHSTAPAGTEGRLEVRLEGLPHGFHSAFRLKCVEQNPIWRDLRDSPLAWGIARRGRPELSEAGGSGAVCYHDESLVVGGVERRGFFMHPPYNGGTGYTWADLGIVDAPQAPGHFEAMVGLKDGGDPSDGVIFRVEVTEPAGTRHIAAEVVGVQRQWTTILADLSRWKGQRVRIRLIVDAGPRDNSTADWACWGEPSIRFNETRLTTQVTLETRAVGVESGRNRN